MADLKREFILSWLASLIIMIIDGMLLGLLFMAFLKCSSLLILKKLDKSFWINDRYEMQRVERLNESVDVVMMETNLWFSSNYYL